MPISTMAYDKLSRQQQEKLIVGLTNVSFSQILHGELGALMVASELVHCLPGHEMKQAASAQVMDEARQLDVFTRYVRRQGEIFPPSPPLKRILDMIARYPLWQGQMVGMQIVIEGIAMATFIDTREATTCPLLKDILHLVIKDEARHISFGKMSLRQHIELMSIEERAQLDSFIIQLLQEFQAWGGHPEDMLNFCQILIEADIDPTDMISATLRDVEAGQPLNLSRGMRYAFTHIILPNLQDLGLVSPEKTNSILQAMPTTQMDFASLDRLKNQLLA